MLQHRYVKHIGKGAKAAHVTCPFASRHVTNVAIGSGFQLERLPIRADHQGSGRARPIPKHLGLLRLRLLVDGRHSSKTEMACAASLGR